MSRSKPVLRRSLAVNFFFPLNCLLSVSNWRSACLRMCHQPLPSMMLICSVPRYISVQIFARALHLMP
ncbi:hypothetical protein CPB85DRAFT_1321674 [Mucidula mucida]|nr:hypothetical protein CPB85DRAFT_1321674 [Mucidula mucida]